MKFIIWPQEYSILNVEMIYMNHAVICVWQTQPITLFLYAKNIISFGNIRKQLCCKILRLKVASTEPLC